MDHIVLQAGPYGNLFDTYVLDSDPVDKWDAFEEFNQKAKTSTILGFKFDTEKKL